MIFFQPLQIGFLVVSLLEHLSGLREIAGGFRADHLDLEEMTQPGSAEKPHLIRWKENCPKNRVTRRRNRQRSDRTKHHSTPAAASQRIESAAPPDRTKPPNITFKHEKLLKIHAILHNSASLQHITASLKVFGRPKNLKHHRTSETSWHF